MLIIYSQYIIIIMTPLEIIAKLETFGYSPDCFGDYIDIGNPGFYCINNDGQKYKVFVSVCRYSLDGQPEYFIHGSGWGISETIALPFRPIQGVIEFLESNGRFPDVPTKGVYE